MGSIELVVYLIKVFEKRCQCHLPLYPVFFYVLSMNAQKLMLPMINHMHQVL